MRCLTSEDIRRMDRWMMENTTAPAGFLMGRAVRGMAEQLLDLCGGTRFHWMICAGPGNNGGDGFGLALNLHQAGHRVQVRVAAAAERIQGDARLFLEAAQAGGVPVLFLPDESDWNPEYPLSPCVDWVIDALLGSGVQSAPRGVIAAAVRWIQERSVRSRVLAIDFSTGLNADTGLPYDAALCVRADFTFTPGAIAPGLLAPFAAEACGAVYGIDLGFPENQLAPLCARPEQIMTSATRLPRRKRDSHKGNYGHVLIWGGGEGMLGAPVLAGKAALAHGAGRVTLRLPDACALAVNAAHPELMVEPENRSRDIPGADVIVIGPGMPPSPRTMDSLLELLRTATVPLILDAGALRMFTRHVSVLRSASAPLFLTPHPGEAAGLLGMSVAELQRDRAAAARSLCEKTGATVLLKGHQTLIQTPEGAEWINLNGNPGMATAGGGDVLAGILAALLAQSVEPGLAAPMAAFQHALAGDRAAVRHGTGRFSALQMIP